MGVAVDGVSVMFARLLYMVKDIVPWLLGPAGIVLGWWLNQRSTRALADEMDERATEADARKRVLDAVRLARQVSSGTRDLLHGMYLKHTTGVDREQHSAMMNEHNARRDQFRDAVLALRVLGPSWAVEKAERVDLLVNRLNELAFRMQQGLTNEQMQSVNTEIPQLDELVNAFVAEVGKHYNEAVTELPPPPDYEAEGRWQPLGS